MKSVWVLACTVFLVTVPSFAQTPTRTPITREALAAILGLSAGTGSCGKAPVPSQVLFAAAKPGPGGGVSEMVTCSANCESGSVQCTADISCQAFHRNCTTGCERGHVNCNDSVNGMTTVSCPTTCPGGTFCCNCAQTGNCYDCCRCDGGTALVCSNCCECEASQDCYSCCRCNGGGINQCINQCFP
jgi:hypothetical protein